MNYITPVFVTALILLMGCGAPSDEQADIEREVPVTAVTVQPQTMRPTLDLIGTLMAVPERTALLTSQVSGQITQVNVVEGQAVTAGEPIALIDSRLIEAELGKAQAALAEALANLSMLEKGPLPEEIEAARQDMRTASASASGRRAKLKALEELRDHNEISEVQYSVARSAMNEADAMVGAASQRLKMLEQGTRTESIAEAQAKVAAAESEVAARMLNVALCSITAPIDGTVAQLPIRQGTYVETPAVLGTIMDLSAVFARVSVPSENLAALREGAVSTVTCEAAGVKNVSGTLARIAKEANVGSGNIDAFIEVPNAEGMLRPGLNCRVRISLPEIPDALAVPMSALADRNGIAVVTVARDGKAYETPVEIGVRTNEMVQITAGISANDVVVTEGGYGLPDGCPLRISIRAESSDGEI